MRLSSSWRTPWFGTDGELERIVKIKTFMSLARLVQPPPAAWVAARHI
jgi:hypothetical protein